MAVEPAVPSIRDQLVDNQKIVDRLNAELARKTNEVRIIQQISSEISSTLISIAFSPSVLMPWRRCSDSGTV